MRSHLLWLALLASACGGAPGMPRVRYRNVDPVWHVADRRPVPAPPEKEVPIPLFYYDALLVDQVDDVLAFDSPRRALNVNSLGEVPDSTWFTNRIGVRDMTAAEVARGPNVGDGPVLDGPWTVVGAKPTGQAIGFEIEDARGDKYFLKFDQGGVPEAETATDVVVQRLLWAFGYNVPENTIVCFRREQLSGGKELSEAELDAMLARVEPETDGSWRALASRRLPGRPIGGIHPTGVRKEDPNDTVPHERRRDLRGQYVAFSWIDHTDVKPQNTLQMWQPLRDGARDGAVISYILDFGKALGVFAVTNDAPWIGHRYTMAAGDMLHSLVTFGTWRRPWERVKSWPDLRGVGRFTAEQFDPGNFHSNAPWEPFEQMDRFDAFWAAKIIMRFTPELIRAAVEQGRYSDPRAADYLTRTLVARQRAIGRYWFRRVTPLDRFTVDGSRLCFVDLWLHHGFETRGRATRYTATAHDFAGHRLEWSGAVTPNRHGRACLPPIAVPAARDGYTIVAIRGRRGGRALEPVLVHVARAPRTGRLRVIGLTRGG